MVAGSPSAETLARPHAADRARAYDRLAPIYDGLASLWSGGQIAACHRRIARRLAPGERVLFVGAGSGRDALAAAKRGVLPTLLDISSAMLSRASRRLRAHGTDPVTIHGDVLATSPGMPFDAVVACFFLNVFAADDLPGIVAHLASMVRPGGRILAADFAPGSGGRFARRLQRIYHDVPMHCFAHWAGNARHPIHDLGRTFEAAGTRVTARVPTRVFAIGPAWLEIVEGRVA